MKRVIIVGLLIWGILIVIYDVYRLVRVRDSKCCWLLEFISHYNKSVKEIKNNRIE